MAINLAALDEKIRKLQLIRSLASDPGLAHLLEDLVTSNGSAPSAPRDVAPKKRKGIKYDVLNFVGDAGSIGDYRTARQITDKMEEAKHKFGSKDHVGTVRENLRELEKDRLVEKHGTDADGAVIWRKTP